MARGATIPRHPIPIPDRTPSTPMRTPNLRPAALTAALVLSGGGLTGALSAQPPAKSTAQTTTQAPAGFTALFNGKDLEGWWGTPHGGPGKVDEPRR